MTKNGDKINSRDYLFLRMWEELGLLPPTALEPKMYEGKPNKRKKNGKQKRNK